VEGEPSRDENSYAITHLVIPWGTVVSESEEAEALADSMETEFQLVNDPSALAFIEMVDVVLGCYFTSPATETKLPNHDEFQHVIRNLKDSRALGPNNRPNRVLKHLQQRAV
jgi:hypothetical protein